MSGIYQFEVQKHNGETQKLADYRQKVLLIVNTASECGFTPQYQGLEALHQRYHHKGLEVLAFPCNQFKAQEPGTDEAIQAFCQRRFGVSFSVLAKLKVNGSDAHPLYRYLKRQAPGLFGSTAIKWNFTKFLVDKEGRVKKRYGPTTKPEAIARDIEALL